MQRDRTISPDNLGMTALYDAAIEAENEATPLPDSVRWGTFAIDRSDVDVPPEFAPGAARFYLAAGHFDELVRPDWEYRPQWWKWHCRGNLYDHREGSLYFSVRRYTGLGCIYWGVERRFSRNSKDFELLALTPHPLFFRSPSSATEVAQLCTPRAVEETGRLIWMPASKWNCVVVH